MTSDSRIQRMARRYEMTPDMVRKLLERSGNGIEVLRRHRRYDKLREGDTVGNQSNQKASGQLPKNQKDDTGFRAGTPEHEGRGQRFREQHDL